MTRWFGDLNTAASLCAAQLPAAGLPAWIASFGHDDYGVGYGGAFGVLCLLLFAPLLLPFLGLVQAFTLTALGTPGFCVPRRP
jgi:hypothetical protein